MVQGVPVGRADKAMAYMPQQPFVTTRDRSNREIILAKIYGFCQLSSHSRGFFARVQIL